MKVPVELFKCSICVGDRFSRRAKAQLPDRIDAAKDGSSVIPVWNKSNREHSIIGSDPRATRTAVVSAVRELGWNKPFFVDADHINLNHVERFLELAPTFPRGE